MKIFCRKIIINKPWLLKEKGPLLLACNHPNSFLDSVILDVLFQQPVWSLTRGDAFISRPVRKIFHALKMLPVYRTSEGAENVTINYKTFDFCLEIFKQKGIVQIFSEGICINEWHLRPLKKGTARLALKTWESNIPLRVLPVGINYSSYQRFGKNIFINFGAIITKNDIEWNIPEGLRYQSFNTRLREELAQLVFEIKKTDKRKQEKLLERKPVMAERILLSVPAGIGWLVHLPLYLPLKKYAWKKYRHSDHYDAVLSGLLLMTYPFYLLLIVLLLFIFIQSWWVFTLLFVLPFTAWSYTQVKEQLD